LRVAQRLQIAEELEFAGGISLFETLQEETAEQAAENAHREKEAAAAADPLVVIGGQTAAGNHAVQVGMKVKVLAPGMEHREEAGLDAKMLGIAGDGEQSFGGGAEKEAVGGLLVVEGDGGDGLGEREDQVEVLGRQQFGAALLQPLFARRALALGAVTSPEGTPGKSDTGCACTDSGRTIRPPRLTLRCGSSRWLA
jgi:hypothetical protein